MNPSSQDKEGTSLRCATWTDSQFLFALRNAPEIRIASLNSAPVSLVDHLAWLNRSLLDPTRRIWIIEWNGEAVGMVRLDALFDTIEISIALCSSARGKGIGRTALAKAMQKNRYEKDTFTANIKGNNAISIALFRQSGFMQSRNPLIYIKPRTQ